MNRCKITGLGLLLAMSIGCRSLGYGVEQPPHCHVAEQLNDQDLTLEWLYFPNFSPLGIDTAPWFHRP